MTSNINIDKLSKKNKNKENNSQSRRDFFCNSARLFAAVAGGVSLLPLLESCETYEEVIQPAAGQTREVDIHTIDPTYLPLQIAPLEYLGYGMFWKFPRLNYGIPVILIRIKKEDAIDSYICLSSMCTHAHCFGKDNISLPPGTLEDTMKFEERQIVCNCHGSNYDPFEGGKVTKGPAERPLKRFKTEFDSTTGKITIYF